MVKKNIIKNNLAGMIKRNLNRFDTWIIVSIAFLFALGVILISSFFIVVSQQITVEANPGPLWQDKWHDADGNEFTRRKPITISNSGSELRDYQIFLDDIEYDSDMQSNFNDLRFVKQEDSNYRELDYWLESKTDGISADVWVKVPSIPSGESTIYMYYGNPSVGSASDGTDTFEFFDDFEDNSINSSIWNYNAHMGSISETTKRMKFSCSASCDWWAAGANDAPRAWVVADPSKDYVVDVKMDGYADCPTNTYGSLGIAQDASSYESDIRWIWRGDNSGSERVVYQQSGQPEEFVASTIDPIYLRIIKEGTTYRFYWSSDGINYTLRKEITGVNLNPLHFHIAGKSWGGNAFEFYFDDFRVRKYVSPEPQVTKIAAEERSPSGEVYDLSGYAWSDNIGWISFNCQEGGPGGSDICGTSDYKVSLLAPSVCVFHNVSGYGWSKNIGWISFSCRNCDSDGDGKSDYEEYKNKTSGSRKDSDMDRVSDYLEDQYYKVILKNGTIIKTYSNKSARDSDNDGLDDWEERYPGKDGFITDAFNNDTDGDGLIDSAEGYSTKKLYENGMRKKIIKNQWNTFSFKAAIGSIITNATITVTISQGEPIEKEDGTTENQNPTDLTVKVYYNGHLLYTNSTESVRYFSNITDITKIMEKNNWNYKGTWTLKIHATENCVLEEFKIEASILLDPLDSDSDNDGILDGEEMIPGDDGWITSPALADTDGDTISDYYEIHHLKTSPVSDDTDGDHAKDNVDKDPLHNLIIKITVYKGHYEHAYWASPILCAVFEVNDNGQKIATPYVKASMDSRHRYAYFLWWVIDEWDVNTTSEFNNKYYIDIPDHLISVKINVELWQIKNSWAAIGTKHLDADIYHRLVDIHGNYINKNYLAKGDGNWVSFKVETMGLPRINTIAVYQNGSFYNGHYPSIERMNMIILKVYNENNIFKKGLNVILIPTSLFANTKLHAIIENAVKEGEINIDLLPDCLKPADFSGIDRDSESISPYIESIITREPVPLDDAMEILGLCITSANETEGIIYNYTVVVPEVAGLAPDVLGMIPFDGRVMQNSPQGKVPRTLWEAFIQFWQDVIKLLYNVLVAIANFIMYLVQTLIEWGLALIGMFQEAVKTIEAVVKAIILLLAYILLALDLFVYIITSLSLLIILGLLSIIIGFNFEWELFDMKIYLQNNKYIDFKYEICKKYYTLIDLELPLQRYIMQSKTDKEIIFVFETSLFEPLNFKYNISDPDNPHSNNNFSITISEPSNNSRPEDFPFNNSYKPTIKSIKYPLDWVAEIPFTLEYELSDYDPIENYEYGYENYSKLYRYRIKLTRIAEGVPVGIELEYVDKVSLTKAIEGRREIR